MPTIMRAYTLRDTPHFLGRLAQYTPAYGTHYQLATVDINSMYPSLNLDKVLRTLARAIRDTVPPTRQQYATGLIDLMTLLMRNCFV
jgi:hypothetical protein